MRLTIPQETPEIPERPVFVSEGDYASFAVPIRFGIRRKLPTSPARYLILLRQHRARINWPWRWGRFVGEI